MEDAFRELMPHEVQIRHYAGADGFGQRAFGETTTHAALIQARRRRAHKPDGTEVMSAHTVYIAGPVSIDAQDQLLLPPPWPQAPAIIAVMLRSDESGEVHHAEVLC